MQVRCTQAKFTFTLSTGIVPALHVPFGNQSSRHGPQITGNLGHMGYTRPKVQCSSWALPSLVGDGIRMPQSICECSTCCPWPCTKASAIAKLLMLHGIKELCTDRGKEMLGIKSQQVEGCLEQSHHVGGKP